jgi:xanthine dehydrogenase accessory factor
MLVSDAGVWGTIGGGRLEFQAIARAREMLQHPQAPAHFEKILLGTQIQQCCGGHVTLWWERYTPADHERVSQLASLLRDHGHVLLQSSKTQRMSSLLAASKVTTTEATPQRRATMAKPREAADRPSHSAAKTYIASDETGNAHLFESVVWTAEELWLFGAGHVGKAIVKTLENLPFRIFWVDNRPEYLPSVDSSQVSTVRTETPEETVEHASPGSWFLIMTHDHAIDFRVVHAVLTRADARYLGLIGSTPKAKHFRNQLRAQGVPEDRIQRLTCPIGLPGLTSKNPQVIAVSAVAQLLLELQSPRSSSST